MSKLAKKIRKAILNDLTDRRGIRQEYDQFDEDIIEEINETLDAIIDNKLKPLRKFEKLDQEAATYVETPIVMRTNFTGDAPYVGWKGLGLALTEALDERDAAVKELAAFKDRLYGK